MSVSSVAGPWIRTDGLFQDERLSSAGFAHGFTTRSLGTMRDAPNRASALKRAGLGDGLFLKQVHGTRVIDADTYQDTGTPPDADGWFSRSLKDPICVMIADCVPLFLWDPVSKAGGVFHIGWRGAIAGMTKNAVKMLIQGVGLAPESLSASMGPHIGACCFKVGDEVASRFRPASVRERDGAHTVDLTAEITAQLIETGIDPENVSASDDCTCCGLDDFFSYRRDKMNASMMAFLGKKS